MSRALRPAGRRVPLLAALLVLLGGAPAAGNGAYTHVHISRLAVAALPPGELRDVLSTPAVAAWLEAGSVFPDSGYVTGHPYGEESHWPRFQTAFLDFLRERYQGQLDTLEAQQEAAFLLGDLSHGMADQLFDHTLFERTLEVDGEGERGIDELADYFLVVDEGVIVETRATGPYEDLARILTDDAATPTTADEIRQGMEGIQSVLTVQRMLARSRYLEAWQTYPFLGTHLSNPEAPGSLPHLGLLVAAAWQSAWAQLRGTASLDEDLLVATIPRDGAENFPVDASSDGDAWRRVGLLFAYGVRRSQVSSLLSLRDPDGAAVPIRIRTPYGTELGNFVMLEPEQPLAYDTWYTAEVAAGVEDLRGDRSTVSYQVRFRTRCAPDRLADCPPLRPPLVAGEIPTEVPPEPGPDAGGGADAGAGADTGAGADIGEGADAGAPRDAAETGFDGGEAGGSGGADVADPGADAASPGPDPTAATDVVVDAAPGGGGSGAGCAAGSAAAPAPLALLGLGIGLATLVRRRFWSARRDGERAWRRQP